MRRPAARAFVIAVFDEGDGSVGRSADLVIRRDGHFQHGHDDSFQRVENPAGTGLTEGRLSPRRGARLDGSSTLAGGQQMLVVALARKLLIALWRFVIDGVMPEGAVMKP